MKNQLRLFDRENRQLYYSFKMDGSHYLDLMEIRPTPKPKQKRELKKHSSVSNKVGESDYLPVVDKRQRDFDRTYTVKEYERILGAVYEIKSNVPESAQRQIFVEHNIVPIRDNENLDNIPTVSLRTAEEQPAEFNAPLSEVEPSMVEPTVAEEEPTVAEKEPAEGVEEPTVAESERVAEPPRVEPTVEEEPEVLGEVLEPVVPATPEKGKTKTPKESTKGRKTKKADATAAAALPNIPAKDREFAIRELGQRVPKQKELDRIVVRAPTYYMQNRKLYTQYLANLFKDFNKELLRESSIVTCDRQGSTTNMELLIHQRIVREYLNVFTPYRGLLLYHGLGSGKTCTSIAIAEAAKTHKRVFVMTPASLKMNFFSELKKCGDPLYKKNQYWEFISIDGRPEYVPALSQILSISANKIRENGGAWLVDIRKKEPNYADLTAGQQKMLDEQLNDMIRAKYVDINYNGLTERKFKELVAKYADPVSGNPFDHSVILVDEAHNLVSRIVNNLRKTTSVAYQLYTFLQSAQDARIVFMSGTPIINYPHELAVLFNMLRGYIKTWKYTITSSGASSLNSDKITKMFAEGGLNAYDYIDYSGETLTITRNPFGFINDTSGKQKPPHNPNPPPQTVMRTVRGGDAEALQDSQLLDSNPPTSGGAKKRETRKKTDKGSNLRKEEKGKNNKKGTKKIRVSIKPHFEEPYVLKDGLLEIPERKPIDLSEDIKQQIELEIHQARNAVGEDPYHSGGGKESPSKSLKIIEQNATLLVGGTPIVDPKYHGVNLDEQGNISDVEFERRVKEILTSNGISFIQQVEIINNKCLPDKSEDFMETFVDMNSLTMQRPDVLKKRILGLTSYFRSAQESLLPQFVLSNNTINPQFHIEYVEMSDHQFVDYAKERAREISREPKQKPGAAGNKELLKTSGSYRTFTRAKCNFSFPSEVPRPMPPGFDAEKDVRAEDLDNIVDDNELDIGRDVPDNVAIGPVSGEYERAIESALEKLKENPEEYLSPNALATYSPKFAKILENLSHVDNRGLHLVYSAFRTLEGIGILKLILEANGFAEFKIKKSGDQWTIVDTDPEWAVKPRFVLYTGTETAEEKEIIRNIYNSNWEFVPASITEKLRDLHENNFYGEIIKIIMITSSGAEGINLENTRFVHIVEPYWHMVRVDQVVGRARRICSHKNLPEELRTIKVFLYMCKFSEKQKTSGENVGIMIRDTSRLTKPGVGAKQGATAITTDETLFEIAVIKDRLTKQLLKSVKESSVDCSIYDNSKEGLVCYNYGHSTTNEFGSFPSYEEDKFVREGADVKEQKVAIKRVEIDGKNYAHNTATNDLYDYDEFKNNKRAVLVGKLGKVNGKNALV